MRLKEKRGETGIVWANLYIKEPSDHNVVQHKLALKARKQSTQSFIPSFCLLFGARIEQQQGCSGESVCVSACAAYIKGLACTCTPQNL